MPFNPGNVRRLNALGGKRPQATGIVLIPKNGDRKLATSNGSTANYGGNTKFGLYPNVGMSYLFQNKIGVGSLFYDTTTPSQVNPPAIGTSIASGESVEIRYSVTGNGSNDFSESILRSDGTMRTREHSGTTSSWNDFFDGDTSNREFYLSGGLFGGRGETVLDNASTIQSRIPVNFAMDGFNLSATGNLNIIILDDANATYSIEVTTTASTNNYTSTPVTFTPAQLVQNGFNPPPLGTGAYHILQLSAGEAGSGADIIVVDGSGGRNPANNNLRLGVKFANGPLVITVTKN